MWRSAGERDASEEAWYALKLKALGVAVEVTKEHTTPDTWNGIVDAVHGTIDRVIQMHDEPNSLREGYSIMFDAATETIRSEDHEVYENFTDVYDAVERELNV